MQQYSSCRFKESVKQQWKASGDMIIIVQSCKQAFKWCWLTVAKWSMPNGSIVTCLKMLILQVSVILRRTLKMTTAKGVETSVTTTNTNGPAILICIIQTKRIILSWFLKLFWCKYISIGRPVAMAWLRHPWRLNSIVIILKHYCWQSYTNKGVEQYCSVLLKSWDKLLISSTFSLT